MILSADNKEKRSGLDRRQYSYDKHIPERRSDQDRRSKLDGFVKSPISALRFISCSLRRT